MRSLSLFKSQVFKTKRLFFRSSNLKPQTGIFVLSYHSPVRQESRLWARGEEVETKRRKQKIHLPFLFRVGLRYNGPMNKPRPFPNPALLPVLTLLILWFSGEMGFAQETVPPALFSVVITGVEGEVRKNIESALTPPEGLVREKEIDTLLLDLFVREAPKKVREALEPFGYYEAEVQTSLERLPEGLRLTVRVNSGEPVRITSLKFSIQGPGAEDSRFRSGLPPFPLKEGEILRQDLYEEAKTAILDKAQSSGYLDAAYPVHRIALDLKKKSAVIELILETGHAYSFGEVTFEPPLSYPEPFLRRYLAFRTGRPFNPQRISQTQLNFINSDRFREARVEALKEEARDYQVPVRIHLTPSQPKRLRFGVGYDTDQGPGVMARYHDLNINHSGHELNAELQISERLQGLALDYIIPRTGSLDDKMNLKGGYKREITDTYESRSLFTQFEYEYRLGWNRVASGYLKFLQEDYSIAGQDGLATMLLPGLKYGRRRYDHPVNPSRGYRYSLETRGSAPFLGADGSFAQFLFQGETLLPMGQGFSLLLRGQGGLTWQNQPLDNLPPSLRFFAGGDNSVRGYDYQTLGPKDSSGRVVGGKHLLVGSVEIEKAISSIWGLAAFYDAGNAFDAFDQIQLKQGAGLGVRFYTPVGPIRIDLARQIGEGGNEYRLHFSIGFGL
jgi:translocation and assembly module TamA